MTLKILSTLLEKYPPITETLEQEDDSHAESDTHTILSPSELIRFNDRIYQAVSKLEELRSIFKYVPNATGPAYKLGHIGKKGGFDMAYFTDVNDLLDKLKETIEEMHMSWSNQNENGAFDNN